MITQHPCVSSTWYNDGIISFESNLFSSFSWFEGTSIHEKLITGWQFWWKFVANDKKYMSGS